MNIFEDITDLKCRYIAVAAVHSVVYIVSVLHPREAGAGR